MLDILNLLLKDAAGRYFETTLKLLKIRAAILYLSAIKGLRSFSILLCLLLFCLMLLAAGLVLAPIALCLFMPWSGLTKALVAGGFAVVYLAVPLTIMLRLLSEKTWMRISRADELLKKLAGGD